MQGKLTGTSFPRLAMAVLAGIAVGLMTLGDATEQLDAWLYDRLLAQLEQSADARIRIVAIDEKSLAELGRWPWPRQTHAELVEKIGAHAPRGIALDILFSEPDSGNPAQDAALAKAIGNSGRVVLPVAAEPSGPNAPLVELLPISALAQAAAGLGHVEIPADADGIARHAFLHAGLGSPHWPALSLALLQSRSGKRTLPEREAAATDSPFLWVRDQDVLLPYTRQPFVQLSYVDVLRDEALARQLRDQWVLVGVTSSGLGKDVIVPASQGRNRISGVEYHAQVLNALLQQNFIRPLALPWQLLAAIALVLLPFALRLALERRPNPWLYHLLAILVTLTLCILLLHLERRWFAPMSTLIVIAASSFVSLGWHLKRSQRLASSDGLTTLANRHMFETSLRREVASARRAEKPVSLLLIDIDYFKQYNDNYGHQAGDALLQQIAEVVLAKARRPRDLASRYGGDEMALLLPETPAEDAVRIGQSLVQNLRQLALPHAHSPAADHASLSIGIATLIPGPNDSEATLLERADAALYQAKRAGRNQASAYGIAEAS